MFTCWHFVFYLSTNYRLHLEFIYWCKKGRFQLCMFLSKGTQELMLSLHRLANTLFPITSTKINIFSTCCWCYPMLNGFFRRSNDTKRLLNCESQFSHNAYWCYKKVLNATRKFWCYKKVQYLTCWIAFWSTIRLVQCVHFVLIEMEWIINTRSALNLVLGINLQAL